MLIFTLTLELSKWLEPLEKLRFEISSIPTLIDYIKQVQICHYAKDILFCFPPMFFIFNNFINIKNN